jgi:hypothetical protein
LATRQIDFTARDYVSKRAAAAGIAIEQPVRIEPEPTGDITRVWIGTPSIEHRDLHCGAGLFWEAGCEQLDHLAPWLHRRIQTIAHFGFDRAEIADFLRRSRVRGGDRWVPFGGALDFDHIWDGIDLIGAFSRQIIVST